MDRRRGWLAVCVCFGSLLLATVVAAQTEPLGYPESIGEEDSGAVVRRRVDEPQVPAGLDPYRAPAYAKDPDGLLAWFRSRFRPPPATANWWIRPGWGRANTPTT